MTTASFFDAGTLGLLEKLAVFGQRRHEVLAGNVANIDTPGYRTRDLPVEEFQQALREAVAGSGRSPTSSGAVSGGQSPAELADFFPARLFRAREADPSNLVFHDGNNRSIEREMMEMTKNSMMQSFAVELMAAQMNLLQAVISERP
ncbi:MAG: flagellar basal body rod protein FlgB [Planctomycetes bacterium]|nr:flagellar basal body rod protein FlgB [Planctomycetota bacterium]